MINNNKDSGSSDSNNIVRLTAALAAFAGVDKVGLVKSGAVGLVCRALLAYSRSVTHRLPGGTAALLFGFNSNAKLAFFVTLMEGATLAGNMETTRPDEVIRLTPKGEELMTDILLCFCNEARPEIEGEQEMIQHLVGSWRARAGNN